MDKLSKKGKIILTVLMIILFPLGIVYCIGINLFAGKKFAAFLGGVLLFGVGMLLAIYLVRPEYYVIAWEYVKGWFIRRVIMNSITIHQQRQEMKYSI